MTPTFRFPGEVGFALVLFVAGSPGPGEAPALPPGAAVTIVVVAMSARRLDRIRSAPDISTRSVS